MATKAANSKRTTATITLIVAAALGLIVAFHGPAGQPGGTPLPSPVPSPILNQKPQPTSKLQFEITWGPQPVTMLGVYSIDGVLAATPVLLNKATTTDMDTWTSSEYDYDGKSIARIKVKATGASTLVCRILVNERVIIERPQRADKFATCQIPFQPAKR